jgi:hypothetical protein
MSYQDFARPNSMALPALKSLAIAGSLWNAGSMTTAWRLLPSIYPTVPTSPKTALKQWEFYYWALSRTVPLTDLATILICSGMAYHEHKTNAPNWKIWASAAGLMPFGWVWVWTLMQPPSNKLLAISGGTEAASEKSKGSEQSRVMDLLKEFNSLMSVRMSFPWVVGGLALWASLS